MKYLKHTFTCESKKDINPLTMEWVEDYEKLHNTIVTIVNVTFKFLTIGLIKVVITYDV